jgi:nucleoside 2-deoxyribosyltransferase
MPEVDWTDDPQVRSWFEHVRHELVPMIADSGTAMLMWPRPEDIDPKQALELGYMLLLDKPIILVVTPGARIPDNLAKVAVRIVEADPDAENTAQRLAQVIAETPDG